MKNYEVRIQIRAADASGEHAEINLGKFAAASITPLSKCASALSATFAAAVGTPKDVVAEHERLVAAQNPE